MYAVGGGLRAGSRQACFSCLSFQSERPFRVDVDVFFSTGCQPFVVLDQQNSDWPTRLLLQRRVSSACHAVTGKVKKRTLMLAKNLL